MIPGRSLLRNTAVLLHGTDTHDGFAGPKLVEPSALDNRQPVVRVPAVAHCVHHDVDSVIGFDVGNHLVRSARLVVPPHQVGHSSGTRPDRVLVDQQDLRAGICRL